MYNSIPGTVTAKVTDISIEDLFESLLRNTEYTYWKTNAIYYFGTKSLFEKRVSELIPINYMQVDDVIGLLPATVTSRATIKKVKEEPIAKLL